MTASHECTLGHMWIIVLKFYQGINSDLILIHDYFGEKFTHLHKKVRFGDGTSHLVTGTDGKWQYD